MRVDTCCEMQGFDTLDARGAGAGGRPLPTSAAVPGGKTSESENTPRAGGLAALGGARL